MSNGNLAGKNVIIIGGTAGIGLATACAAAEQGARVWAAGRSRAHIDTANEVSCGRFEVCQADTHDATALEAIYKEAGTVDHLVSAAVGGERTLKPFLEQSQQQFQAAYNKLWGYCNAVRTGAPYLNQEGSITLVSGSPARKIVAAQSPLSCVGASVENLVRCLAVEMAPVRVNVVSPGTIDTAMFDHFGAAKADKLADMSRRNLIPRAGSPEEVAAGILFVMGNSFITGTTVDVDGGRLLS